jgi:hypothetical protein
MHLSVGDDVGDDVGDGRNGNEVQLDIASAAHARTRRKAVWYFIWITLPEIT